MDTKKPMQELEDRAFNARLPLYELCARAKVSSAAFTRSKAGKSVRLKTLKSLENAMADIEAERRA